MSKPWLERWGYANGQVVAHRGGQTDGEIAAGYPERLVLMSAAPDMCRALLAVEYAGWCLGCDVGHECCPKCEGCTEEFCHPDEAGHHYDCPLDAALTRVGLPTQESRDAARAEIAGMK